MSDGATPWPVPKFHFKVTFEGVGELACQEVSGLDSEQDIIEYRASNSVDFGIPRLGQRKAPDVSLKKGIFKIDSDLYNYFMKTQMNTVQRKTVTIQLLDESHKVVFLWTLQNAFPLRFVISDMDAQSNDVAVEEIVLSYESMQIANS